jgi:hypothetical protein
MNKIKNNIIGTVSILLIAGSIYFTWRRYQWNNPPYSPEINAVLFMAGDNRAELEKVLKHYSKNPADSLKLRAAEFLTVNMPGKYSLEYEAPFENIMAVYLRWDDLGNREAVEKAFGLGEQILKRDVEHITGDYLINNIELAFKMWKEQPWGKNVPFDVFCEEILPYRVANEPLENWREKALATFDKVNRSFRKQPGMSSVEACFKVNLQLPTLKQYNRLPEMNYSMIMTVCRGMCDEMSALAIFAMRALGIPVSQECTPKWPFRNVGHTWNSVYDSAGRRVSFMGTEVNPGSTHHGSRRPKSKIYRLTYAQQTNIDADADDIPPSLRNPFMKDVTEEYVAVVYDSLHKKGKDSDCNLLPKRGKRDIPDSLYVRGRGVVLDPLLEKGTGVEVPLQYRSVNGAGYAYLASTGEDRWHIVGWGRIDSDTVRFGAVGRHLLYLPVYYSNGVQTAAGYPFLVNNDNSIRIFKSDTLHRLQFTLSRISPSGDEYKDRMINGVFEGANRSDFSDAKVLYTVQKASGEYFSTVKVRNSGSYSYVRYVSPKGSYCHVAEIIFYNDKGERLQGKPVGSPGILKGSSMTFEKAFDNDISTFYDAKLPDDSWTGLALNNPQTIAEIQYLPRNEGNGIYKGHTCELFFWDNNGWQFLEKQEAENHLMHFRLPVNTVLHFKNITTGKTGRWFILNENGEQQWM